MDKKAIRLTALQANLGEGPLWDVQNNVLRYVDITGRKLLTYDPAAETCSAINTSGMCGCLVPDGKGGLIAAERDTLVCVNPAAEEEKALLHLDIAAHLRFNDGKCDCSGRLWVGTMATDQTHPLAKGGGALYRIDAKKGAVRVLSGMTIPNGIAFNRENTLMYHIDTATQCISRYRFDAQSGEISHRETAVSIPQNEGAPDGMAIDEEGMLWVALWGGGQVARFNPDNGKKIGSVAVPTDYVSCCAFGGEHLDRLYITTAMDKQGNGGQLYTVKTDTRGTLPFAYETGGTNAI